MSRTSLKTLKSAVDSIGKPAWRPMLGYVAELHEKSIHPAQPPFPHPWEEIGPGYCYGPAFGHWDIVHQVFDSLPFEADHARDQLRNNLAAQTDDGLVPGVIWMHGENPRWRTTAGHPPVWPVAVDDYVERYGPDILTDCYRALRRQIGWFEQNRRADERGFFYTDILDHQWESGVDEGIRFLDIMTGPKACIDACSHMFLLYDCARRWARALGEPAPDMAAKAEDIKSFIQDTLYVPDTGFFHDIWGAKDAAVRCLSFEGMWPVVVGAATPEQARHVIHDHLLNPERFLSPHPITSVSLDDPRFELRCWRGPTWNSMTYWAARGCLRYGEHAAARCLLERALDCSAAQYERTGTIWEFYHPHGGAPETVQRKPDTAHNSPCPDYLGHNPLIAMAVLFDRI